MICSLYGDSILPNRNEIIFYDLPHGRSHASVLVSFGSDTIILPIHKEPLKQSNEAYKP